MAVYCNPNATRVAPHHVAGLWMKPEGTEPALAAMLYGPCEVKTEVAGTHVRFQETTGYP